MLTDVRLTVLAPGNLMMVPVGILAILASTFILEMPRAVMAAVILLFSLVGAFAISGTVAALWIVLALGLMGYYMEKVGIPLVLGIITLGLWGLLILRAIREIARPKPQAEGQM